MISSKRGFTLVELSIVIVIIGLIVAGVTAGQSLVHQSKIRAVYTEKSDYEVAINSFIMKYNALPGDIPNANSYWPGCNSGATAENCNGNGNRKIDYIHNDSNTNGAETLRAWQHLSLAGLINGSYSGVTTENTKHTKLNSPSSSFATNALWAIFHYDYEVWTQPTGLLNKKLRLQIGNEWDNLPFAALFTALDASTIDRKYDDGMPQLGQIIAINVLSTHPVITGGRMAQYDPSNATIKSHILSFDIGN
jgi:prepilin-type N-terminal cleavage/methylation domain-containing protein